MSKAKSVKTIRKAKIAIALMWSRADVIELFSNNVGPFSFNVSRKGSLFSINLGRKPRMFSSRSVYVLKPLQITGLVGDNGILPV
jgi:hypothetical protein